MFVKHYFLTTALVSFSLTSFSQVTADCLVTSGAGKYLDINNVRTIILPAGGNFWDLNNGVYEVPKGSGKHAIFAGSLVVGGIDASQNIRMAAETYRQTGVDFWPGPIDNTESTNQSTCNQYDRVWKLNKSTVDSFKVFYNDPSYQIPQEILTWPGTPPTGYSGSMAPFSDLNNNGIYEPLQGEYPAFDYNNDRWYYNELHGDQVIYKIYNDVGNVHTETGTEPLGLEIHQLSYAYSNPGTSIDNATIHDFKIYNKGSETLNDTYLGMFIDGDLGNYIDDLLGTHVSLDMAYVYNGDNDDDGASGYGPTPPAIGFKLLKGPLADELDGADNNRNGIVDEPNERNRLANTMIKWIHPFDHYDQTPYDWLQSQRAPWDKLRYGGNGQDSSNPVCNFVYPGHSDTAIGWGLGGTPTNPVPTAPWFSSVLGDAAARMGFGKFTLSPGDVKTFTIGIQWSRASSGNHLDSRDLLFQEVQVLQNVFNKEYANNYVGIDLVAQQVKLQVYPNPATDVVNLNWKPDGKFDVQLLNTQGQVVLAMNGVESGNQLDVSALPDGIYMLRLSNEAGALYHQKLLINK